MSFETEYNLAITVISLSGLTSFSPASFDPKNIFLTTPFIKSLNYLYTGQ